jgi:hypothetical protein
MRFVLFIRHMGSQFVTGVSGQYSTSSSVAQEYSTRIVAKPSRLRVKQHYMAYMHRTAYQQCSMQVV